MSYLNSKYLIPVAIAVVLIIFILIGSIYFFTKKNQTVNQSQDSAQLAAAEVKKIVSEVGKLIDLPTGEDPTVATVTDVNKLKDQSFFQKAKNGDKVLIYTNAKKAILYDTVAKKVLEVAPINIGSASAQISQLKIVLRNGTSTVGLATKIESELKKSIPLINIVDKDNAAKNSYEKTLVVVLNDSGKDAADSLIKELNASASALPSGESKPKDADILIILGKDKI